MAKHAKRLVAKNGMEGVVDVIQSSVEELELPGKVIGYLRGSYAPAPSGNIHRLWRTHEALSSSSF